MVRNQGRRTPKNQRTPEQAELDREKIASLYLQNWTQQAISDEIGVTQQQISYDLKIIRKRWREAQIRSYNEHVELQLAKIDQAEREYWAAWAATKGEESIETTEKGMTPKGEIDKVSVRRRKTHGTPAYMDGILKCIEQRSKLLQLEPNAAIGAVIRLGYEVTNPMTGEKMELGVSDADASPDSSEDSHPD